jgi:hypothetical protein
MLVQRKSMLSGTLTGRELDITPEQILDYESGALLQHAFPNLNADDREFFKTGITEEEWDAAFGGEAEKREEEDLDDWEQEWEHPEQEWEQEW